MNSHDVLGDLRSWRKRGFAPMSRHAKLRQTSAPQAPWGARSDLSVCELFDRQLSTAPMATGYGDNDETAISSALEKWEQRFRETEAAE